MFSPPQVTAYATCERRCWTTSHCRGQLSCRTPLALTLHAFQHGKPRVCWHRPLKWLPVSLAGMDTAAPSSKQRAKLAALGRIAVTVSPSGLLFPYYLGVFRALDELALLDGAVLAGSSGGALMGAFVCSGLSVDQAEAATKGLYASVMQQVSRQDLLQLLRAVLQVRASPSLGRAVTSGGVPPQPVPHGTSKA